MSDAAILTTIATHAHFDEANGELESDDDDSSDSIYYGYIYDGSAYIWPIALKNRQYFAMHCCH